MNTGINQISSISRAFLSSPFQTTPEDPYQRVENSLYVSSTEEEDV